MTTISPTEQYKINQIVASISIEGMSLTDEAYQNLQKLASNHTTKNYC